MLYFNEIRYGTHKGLDVLIDPNDNSLWVTTPTIEKLLGYRSDSAREKLASKSLKTFTGKGLTVGKTFTAKDSLGRPNKVKGIPFDTFLSLVYWEAFEGGGKSKEAARALVMAGFADSFSSLVLEQCGVKLTKDQRQQTIEFYLTNYHEFHDWVRDTHIQLYGVPPERAYYKKINQTINQHLFKVDNFKSDRLANAMTPELRKLENFQMFFMDNRPKQPTDPLQALKNFINR